MTKGRWLAWQALAIIPLCVLAEESSQTQPQPTSQAKAEVKPEDSQSKEQLEKKNKDKKKSARTKEEKKKVAEILANKDEEMKALQAKAQGVTSSIGDLAKSGKIPTDSDAIAIMKKMVEELQEINEKLKAVQEDVEAIKGWIEGQNEALPILTQDVADLKRIKDGTYIQFQYRDSNERSSSAFLGQHAFATRRIRVSTTRTIDSKTSFKISFDLSTGTDTTAAQLRDAQLIYDIIPSETKVGLQLLAGQQILPLGYELGRSSSEREFPERATYNRRMFDGERNRGVYLRYGLNDNTTIFGGIGSSLTFNDPEQRGLSSTPRGRVAGYGGIRFHSNKFDVGVSAFYGKRPAFVAGTPAVTSPEVSRQFVFLDASYIGLIDPRLFVRSEVMFGKDRVPSATASPLAVRTNMVGWQVLLGFNINPRNQLSVRMADFDPNTSSIGNAVREYGAVYRYFINPNASISLAYEVFLDPARRPNRFNVATLRYQFKF